MLWKVFYYLALRRILSQELACELGSTRCCKASTRRNRIRPIREHLARSVPRNPRNPMQFSHGFFFSTRTNAEKLKELAEEALRALKDKHEAVLRDLKVYLRNKETEFILFKPIKVKTLPYCCMCSGAWRQWVACCSHSFTLPLWGLLGWASHFLHVAVKADREVALCVSMFRFVCSFRARSVLAQALELASSVRKSGP